MTWSLFDLFRRRLTKTNRPTTVKRKAPFSRCRPWLEMLEERAVPTTITQNINSTAIASGRTLWFSSIINSVSGVTGAPVNVTVSNQTISFTDSTAGTINVPLPNAVITLTPGGTTATTTFDTANNRWSSNDPTGLSGNLFVSGYALPLPSGLHGGDSVTWTATFTTDTSGVSFNWAWGAAAYSSFSTTYTSDNIKPCDNSTVSAYKNTDKAATPEAYKAYVVGGGTGSGTPNYTGNLSGNTSVTPTYTPTNVTLAGTVYNDANNNGTYDSANGDTGLAGVTLTLTGTTAGGPIVAATTTTAADGTYSFATDGSGAKLVAGTYQITETQPAGYYQGTDNPGTVGGSADGTLTTTDTFATIALTAGQNGINYNFGEISPYAAVTPAYPYVSGNLNTNIAFNESQVLAGASVNVANNTFNIFYADEHALALGVRETDVNVLGNVINGSKTVTITTLNGTSGLFVGEAVFGSQIAAGTTIASISGNTITLSAAATANSNNTTLTFVQATYPTSQLPSSPGAVTNPQVGLASAVDAAGRPMFPSLYLTDITANPNSTSGDWQNGGTAIAPNAIYGTWKSFVNVVDKTAFPNTTTATADADPTGNGWTLGAGSDPVPSGITGDTYGAEAQWSLTSLYNSGLLIPGHNYRFYFIVHDGDQNQAGGDCGQAAYTFTYRGPVTIAGNVYKDNYGNGVDGAGDVGIGGVTLTLSGTASTGGTVTATTTTAADGTYKFTTDSSGNLLHGGTYQITETQPAGYLQGINTVGLTDWSSAFTTTMSNSYSSGTGYAHEVGGSSSDTMFSGAGSLDTKGLANWHWTSAAPAATDNIVDAFGANYNDSLTGHNFLLTGIDRYANTANTTVGFWAFQNAVSVNAGGTFSGVHTDGDLFIVTNISVNGATSQSVYRWTGNDATGSLTLLSPAVGATYLNVNIAPSTVPWAFTDNASNTKPQAGELVEAGVDLNAIFGLTVPHFTSFLTETRSTNTSGASLLDFVNGTLNTIAGSFTANGTLVPTDKIGSIAISDGQNGINYNFGEVQPVTIAGTIYTDKNGNGTFDAGDTGISGVTLTLTGTNNLGQSVTATVTTGANGTYTFTTDSTGKLLSPGTYQIVETHPSGYLPGATAVGTDNGTTDGTVVSPGTIGSIVVYTGDNAVNYNFGEYQPVTLSGLVYKDTNGNNAMDAGELGLAGVTLSLSGTNGLGQAVTATTTTAADGSYSFSTDGSGNQLRPGNYTITETVPSGYVPGAAAVGTVNGTADGTASSATQISAIALTSGQSGINYRFGVLQPVTVSGLVYADYDGNGAFNLNDLGIGGVTLTLSGTNGAGQAVTATATTAITDGTFTFTTDTSGNPIRPGTYQIVETAPAGYFVGAAAVGTVNGTVDGTASSGTKIVSIALISGQTGINYQFGNLKAVSITGTVYQDMPGNNTYGAGDPGVAGVTLTLTGTNNQGQSITATTVSAADGTFVFNTDSIGNPLFPGTYTITETIPQGYLPGANFVGHLIGTPNNYSQGFTQALSGSGPGYTHNSALDSFKNGSSDTAGVGTWGWQQGSVPQKDLILDGFASTYVDPSGHTLLLASSDRYANNGDSTFGFWFLQNPVSLNAAGTFNGSHTTGDLLVVNDFAGSSGSLSVYEWVGTDGAGSLQPVTLPAGSSYFFTNTSQFSVPWPFLDAGGFTAPQSGEYMAIGIDANAIFGANMPHYVDMLVESRASNSPTAQLKSFLLAGLSASVGANAPDGQLVGNNQITAVITSSGTTGVGYNFGLVKPVTLAGTVYQDTNGNNAFDAGEPGIGGVTLALSGTNNLGQMISATTTTAANGTYSFTADLSGNLLRPGSYTITETQPSGYLLGAAAAGTVNGTVDGNAASATTINSIALTSGQNGVNYLFGDYKPVTVSGTVYQDSNGNNAFDAGEPGISGVTLTLTGTNGLGQAITATTTTAANGTYSFGTDSSGNQLRPGTYTITETQPSGFLLGGATVGTVNGTTDGSAASATVINAILLTSGQGGINYLFGDYKPVTVAGTVYQDINGNNAFDSGEPGIAGVTVTLSGTNGLGQAVTSTTTTAANGTYSFSTDSSGNQLRPGTYTITETQPSGYLLGAATVGTVNGAADGTVSSPTKIVSIALTSGQGGISYLFGDVLPVTVSGTVYQDTNGNNAFNGGEPGIAGVTVTLSGTNGVGQAITATTTTAANGTYSFSTDSSGNQLRPGSYTLTETQPAGYLLGAATVGTVNGTADGTAASATVINSIALTSGQSGISYLFGDYKAVTLAGTVYQDTNGNNAFDAGEPGISGVTLTLSGTNGLGQAITATATTAANGTYSFSTDSSGNQLRPGTYTITETQPSGYLLGAATVGTVNGTTDGTAASATVINSIALTSGQSGISYLFGDYKAVTLAGTVYQDTNGNNAFDAGEPGISGVTLTLSGTNGLGQAVTATTTTAANGTYSFTTDASANQLRPGTYTITETQPSGFLLGAATVGTVNGTADGAAASATVINAITLTSGQSGISYLFGDYKPVTLAGTVYQDTNGNNAFDSGEPGIAGVTVTLSGTNGLGQAITATTTTAANGTYSFSTDSGGNQLRPGTYTITETQPSGYLLGAATVGTVNGTADGTITSATKISSIALTSGQGGINYLFGDYKAVTLAGQVYQDTNGNGALDAGETGIAGVTLALSGTNGLGQAITATATTAANGTYSFSTDTGGNQLRPGTYVVTETVPSGYIASAANVGTVSGTADGTAVSATQITTIAMTSGQSGISYNFGDVKAITLAGLVYHDVNGNGVQDGGEVGLAGVTVTLSGTNGLGQAITATATTAANGTYSFTTDSSGNLLRPGTYTITESVPSGYMSSAANLGTVGGTADGTLSSATAITSIALTSGQSGINYNFGDVKAITLSGLVYQDTNGNGAFDSGEPGITGVTVTLSGTSNLGQAISATAITAANGTYSFTTDSSGNALRPGTYSITETAPSGYLLGSANLGTVNGAANGTVTSATKFSSIAPTSGQAGINYNFGDVLPVSISGTVYQDTNGNNAFNAGEPGIAGVTLTLSGTNGLGQSISATATTAADGTYSFATDSSGNKLRPGTYQVVETQPSGYLLGAATVGTVNGTADGNAVSATTISSIALTSNQNGISYNFGDYKAVTLAGTVYQDTNGNNAFDAGEPGIAGVTVTLSGTNGLGQSITATATTAANGTYSFSTDSSGNSLRPGTYTITETLPSGYLAGAATVGTVNGSADGTAASATAISSILLTSGQSGINYLFGNVKGITLSGTVYQDSNGNNAFDAGEPGISGVTVTLSGTNNLGQSITATATTAANGTYSFSTDSSGNALRPGTYTITETQPSGYLLGAAAVGTVNGSADGTAASATTISSIVVTSGQSGFNYLFGDYKPVTLSGTVYQDANGNNAFNAGEPGIAGVTVTLSGTNGLGQAITATTTTAADGTYSFSTDSSGNTLRPGTYTITEMQPSGYQLGAATVGTVNGSADGTVTSATNISAIALTSGQGGINYNFGDYKPVTVSGLVYEDTNGNGAYDAGEPGIAGVTVTLNGTNGLGQSVTATTTTAADGTYRFSTDSGSNVLRPGTYQVVETQPSGYLLGAAAVGTVNGTTDGTAASATTINSIVMTSGQAGINYLFGDVKAVTVSGTVYQDTNGNGSFDSGEPGIAGVTLTLSGTNNLGQSITASAATAANGTYTFSTDSNGNALRPGTYQIVETQPSGYLLGSAAVGTVNGTADGTLVSATKITSIALTSGQSGINYLFGDVKAVTISGTVYQDSNGNNAFDAGEPSIAGVTVTLSGTNNLGQAITATATTAANGTYSFSTDSSGNALRPGTYTVTETQPSGYLLGAAAVGTVNGSADGTAASATMISGIAMASGQSGINYLFGDYKPVTLAGTVYVDANANGVMDAGEAGIAGVTVTLGGTNGLGQAISATATTAANGTYSLSTDSSGNTLRPGTYQIVETPPSGYLLGAANVGTVSGSADGTAASATTINAIVMTSGQSGINYNFGDYKPVTVSGMVYEDTNGNGAYDSGEPAIAGVTVTLSGTNGLGQSVSATTTTAADGTYSFSTDSSGNQLRPGTYTVTETQPSGYLTGAATVGTVNGNVDGSASSATKISSIVLTSGQSGINYLFGDVKAVTISGLVYVDTNGNGVLDSGEPGISGVTLTLTGTNGLGQTITATAATAANGTYTFSTDTNGNALRPGTYQVVESVPSAYLTGSAAAGTVNGATDGTVSSATTISSIALTSGQSGINYLFGDLKADAISGTVYLDSNSNGALDSGETGIAGVTLTLSGTNNLGQSITATTTTTANGTYGFSSDSNGNPIRPGTYQVVETAPSAYFPGATTVGTVNGATDGTVVSSTTIGSIVLVSGQSGVNYNFGHFKPVTISGTVYQDTNGNGTIDSGEPGLAGITVSLSGTNGLGQAITATTTTAADGTYSFSTDGNGNLLRPGTYAVSETIPSGYVAGTANVGTVNGSTDGTATSTTLISSIVMTSGQTGINYNFADYKPVTISGLVYLDPNGFGVFGSGATGFANVTVTLSGTNGLGQAVTATTTTGSDGSYSFSTDSHGNTLRPGTYQITATTPSGYVAVGANVGTVNGASDGTATGADTIKSIAMTSGQTGINYDFGVSVPASVSGYVYIDYDGSQTFSANNAGFSGVTVKLTGTTTSGQSVSLTTTTDNSGYYIFADLANGTYTVTVVAPGGIYNPDIANVGTVNGTADGAANANLLEIDQIVLRTSQQGHNYDFGFQPPFE
jgi:hypothetical protein